MTISKRVQKELFQAVPASENRVLKPHKKSGKARLHRAPSAAAAALAEENKGKAWTKEEHERFLLALEVYPSGPWKAIAAFVGTKNSRQTMTHAQKYRQKHERRQRGLRSKAKKKRAAATTRTTTKRVAAPSVTVTVPASPVATHDTEESESPRSGEECSAIAYFEPVTAGPADETTPSNFDENWTSLKTTSNIMEIFPDFEPLDTYPGMWSTHSLEETAMSGNNFDFFNDGSIVFSSSMM